MPLAGDDVVCVGEVLGVGVVRGLALVDGAYDLIGLPECVAHVAQFAAETIAVVQEPLLEALHEIPWEVCLIGGRISVLYDLIESAANKRFVSVRRQMQAFIVEPGGGPGNGLAKNDVVPEKRLGILTVIKIVLDTGKDFRQ